MDDPAKVAGTLTKAQRDAVLGCERHGNGRYPYAMHGLAKCGVMSLQLVTKPAWPDGFKAYRPTPLGQAVATILKGREEHD